MSLPQKGSTRGLTLLASVIRVTPPDHIFPQYVLRNGDLGLHYLFILSTGPHGFMFRAREAIKPPGFV